MTTATTPGKRWRSFPMYRHAVHPQIQFWYGAVR
jgi:hypothetical protein